MSRLLILLLLTQAGSTADLQNKAWHAWWIAVPGAGPQDYGVYHFRRTFQLPDKPASFVVHLSGDNRFQLFANGTRVAVGPARGDLTHWRYETVDLAPYLAQGKNVLAAVVWNDGERRAIAQITNRTGFLLEADDQKNATIDSSKDWKCLIDKAYTAQPLPADQRTGYYALGPNEKVDGRLYPWGWESPAYDDNGWQTAEQLSHGAPRDLQDGPNRWMLVPSEIPLEEQRPEPALVFRQPQTAFPLTIPAGTTAAILLDQKYLTTAYPELVVSGGKDAEVRLQYAETLYEAKGHKGNRNEVEGRLFFGPSDTYIADGSPQKRMYRPLFWRTYRYLKLTVKTGTQGARIESLKGTFTAYPFERKGGLEVDDKQTNPELQQILNVGWRTARLCAHETYMDCPFYEQLQYGGDARIQMMISLYMTGDARLMKNGIGLLNSSRTAEGATYSRAPSYLQQYIPPFSLWWIGMVHDY
ncbi:MAG TPA: alpha-L-rhamnosidase N-terminal domain-containing protein, partial [Bryobacteraceae bacterium]|nr:alpha-L-rhamnosidase N-terminal domain-containing protein [Bryobacteraceae bacterium]